MLVVTTLIALLCSVIAVPVPRNDTTSIAPGGVDTSSGVSRIVTASIIVVLILAILSLLALHIFRKWSIFGLHIKRMLCCNPRSTPPRRYDHTANPIEPLHRTTTVDSSVTLTPSMKTVPAKVELQRPPRVELPMARGYTARGGR